MYNEMDQNNNIDKEYYEDGMVDSTIVQERIISEDAPKKPGKGKKAVKFIAGALVFGLVAGTAFQGVNFAVDRMSGSSNKQAIEVQADAGEDAAADLVEKTNNIANVNLTAADSSNNNTVSEVAKNVMPSIVAINCSALNSVSDMFGRQYQQQMEGSGSGIIIGQNDKEVLIVTNNHVVSGEDADVQVVFADDSTAKATIKGTDSSQDLAVIAVNIDELSEETKNEIRVATLGDSENTKVGEMVIAIGNALGYGQSVTVGYVSAKDRQISIEDATMTLLQTDAAINPGNSGGALLNAKGEVIGINSAKLTSTDIEGIGYAIPISKAIPIINDLMNREELADSEKAYLGITPRDVTDDYNQRLGLPKGVFVLDITAGSPAEQAGLKAGSIIVGMNGRAIETSEELQEYLSYTKAGTKAVLDIKIMEDGEYQDQKITVTLGNKPIEGGQ